jgi:DNA-binding CsgD family transcriptional regulator/catechol 2,3-dioxygenase-like lactoylglutathione lyase family enzyme
MSSKRPRGRPPHDDALTPAEWRVVEAVRHGMTNRIIAERLGVSLDAVKFHVANAQSKLGIETRAQLKHWSGISRASALHSQEKQMDMATVTIGPIGQIARSVRDLDAATAWYRDVLGLAHLFTAGGMSFFQCGEVRLLLGRGEAEDNGSSILYFRVADIRAAHAALASRGIVFSNAPHMIHRHDNGMEEWMAFFADNEGRPLAIMSQVMPAA